jgi:hypothetical protein
MQTEAVNPNPIRKLWDLYSCLYISAQLIHIKVSNSERDRILMLQYARLECPYEYFSTTPPLCTGKKRFF